MATIGLFLHPNEIKENGFVDENVDDKSIRVAILLAMQKEIFQFLGSGLYNEIKGQVENETLTADNQTLLSDYIQPALEWWAMYYLVKPMVYKITNKSIMRKNSENSNPIGANEVTDLRNDFKNFAEERTQRLISFLCENDTTYPLYLNPGTGSDVVYPRKFAYETGWNLQGSTYKNPNTDDPKDNGDYAV